MKSRGQVWVETMIYTLIFLTLIGVFLAYAQPKINEMKEKATIEQSLNLLEDIDNTIMSIVQGGAGNRRLININLKDGKLRIDGENNKIVFEMETTHEYTEPHTNPENPKIVEVGRIEADTLDKGKINKVSLTKDYDKYNLTYNGKNKEEVISKSANPYKMYISNTGKDNGKIMIDFEVE